MGHKITLIIEGINELKSILKIAQETKIRISKYWFKSSII